MKNRSSSKTSLFLMELIIAIFFFSLAGALCIQMFVESHRISKDSVALHHGVLWTQNFAESFYGCSGNPEDVVSLFKDYAYVTNDAEKCEIKICFDENFKPIYSTKLSPDDQDYSYVLTAKISPAVNNLITCEISFNSKENNRVIYSLMLDYFPGGK
ncbi:MAG: hypothetical protein J6J79_08870 [Lachnospiraceae bacterium]|nr:hypothetical protein [Lachnospiraceae bacterium]